MQCSGPACSVLDSREDVRDGRGVARACVLGRRWPNFLRGGRRVRIRAYRDLRRLSAPTPGPLRLQHLPFAVWASTLWEQRACVLDGAIGRGPAQVRVSGGLVRAVCSAWRSSLWRWDAAARKGPCEGHKGLADKTGERVRVCGALLLDAVGTCCAARVALLWCEPRFPDACTAGAEAI